MFHHSIYSHLVGGKAPKWKKSLAALFHLGTHHLKIYNKTTDIKSPK